MYRSRDEIQNALKAFFQSMVDLANKDQVIDDDEQKILDTIKKEIETMEDQLFQILESGLHQEEFKDLELQILGDILTNVTKVAEEDGIITEEESALITQLKEFAKTGVIPNE